VAVKGELGKRTRTDDRLPLRWAVILFAAVAAGLEAGTVGGVVAGWGTALATAAVLHRILGV